MCDNALDVDGVLIDVSGLSLRDVDEMDGSSLGRVIRMLLDRTDVESIASFESRV
jgi:FXSXX-COOH protein